MKAKKSTSPAKKQPIVVKDLKAKKNPKGGSDYTLTQFKISSLKSIGTLTGFKF